MQMSHVSRSMHSRRGLRHVSRFQGCLIFTFVGILMMLCTCTASLALYIAFPPAPIDILIMGLDTRGNEGTVTRSDSIMLVGINPSRLDVSLLSIPRDLFIEMPNYGLQRINTINVLAELDESGSGPRVLAQSIQNNFGIEVDAYLRLDFQAFTALVDSVGGLDIEVPYAIVDYQYPTENYGTMEVRFEAGWQHMDGERALIYARTRHADDDYRRAERQQLVISALAQKLINPLYWGGAWWAIQSNTETNLSPVDMAFVLPSLLFGARDMNRLVIDRNYILAGDGFSYPNYNAIRPFIEEHFD